MTSFSRYIPSWAPSLLCCWVIATDSVNLQRWTGESTHRKNIRHSSTTALTQRVRGNICRLLVVVFSFRWSSSTKRKRRIHTLPYYNGTLFRRSPCVGKHTAHNSCRSYRIKIGPTTSYPQSFHSCNKMDKNVGIPFLRSAPPFANHHCRCSFFTPRRFVNALGPGLSPSFLFLASDRDTVFTATVSEYSSVF